MSTDLIRSRGQHRRPRVRYSPPLSLFVAFWVAFDVAAALVASFVWAKAI